MTKENDNREQVFAEIDSNVKALIDAADMDNYRAIEEAVKSRFAKYDTKVLDAEIESKQQHHDRLQSEIDERREQMDEIEDDIERLKMQREGEIGIESAEEILDELLVHMGETGRSWRVGEKYTGGEGQPILDRYREHDGTRPGVTDEEIVDALKTRVVDLDVDISESQFRDEDDGGDNGPVLESRK